MTSARVPPNGQPWTSTRANLRHRGAPATTPRCGEPAPLGPLPTLTELLLPRHRRRRSSGRRGASAAAPVRLQRASATSYSAAPFTLAQSNGCLACRVTSGKLGFHPLKELGGELREPNKARRPMGASGAAAPRRPWVRRPQRLGMSASGHRARRPGCCTWQCSSHSRHAPMAGNSAFDTGPT